jgi:quercetin dioxygenase-like cupin family protein
MSQRDRAADYVMGMLSAQERTEVERDAVSNPALAADIARLNEELAPLLLDAPEVEPPADLFDRIKSAIASDKKTTEIPGSRTVRAGEGRWEPLVPGIERKVLYFDRERKRVTLLIRAQAGAEFPAHEHDDDEESYVLSGDLSFDDLMLNAGDYHVARAGERHPVGRTKGGCMLIVTAAA